MPKQRVNVWRVFAKHPPILVRLLARRRLRGGHVEALSSQEIAIASAIPLDRVLQIEQSTTWANVTFDEAERYCLGCNFDPTSTKDRNRYNAYKNACKRRPGMEAFRFLKKSPWWMTEFLPLINRYKSHMRSESLQGKSPSQQTR